PEAVPRLRDEAELEGDAAEDEREQHRDDRQIERRHDDRIGPGKGDPEAAAAEHEPGLVSIPIRRDRIHHLVTQALAASHREQDADAEIETVEDHVEPDSGGEQAHPDHREIVAHAHRDASGKAARAATPVAEIGRFGSPSSAATTSGCGPLLMSLLIS